MKVFHKSDFFVAFVYVLQDFMPGWNILGLYIVVFIKIGPEYGDLSIKVNNLSNDFVPFHVVNNIKRCQVLLFARNYYE